ncbi:venom carboxylesterase-6-like isoform X2 [Daktulosphaira vitifoliae]|uniref:venom carboxylesterase-6-like isoform X2 n=1 Tax=Daktulosphaira vitifoliae TaxID=58002 RepID=UPI0021AAAD55|nr:venom carboxylesterase-6-like isoform X2 [Daktulosphaira vitifoliae]
MRFLMIIIIARIFEAAYCYPFIYTQNGPIRGQTLKSRENRSYYSFTGIPFAKPPIDEYRFKAPEPPVPWNISLDATNPPKPCLQLLSLLLNMTDKLLGDEDCLYLNVYTPNINEKLPVMFWIHGGGFVIGQSGPALYGPEYFMDKNVVLVTSNYRLGLLGFLSTEDDVIPGNYGLKDQVLALRWVKENIRQFGGDPDHVTIFGESAGSASVGYHLLSPLSKGLFHKAIMQSGSPLCKWAIAARGVAFQRAKRVANMAGCKTDTSHVMLKCLRSLKASVITQMYPDFFEWVNNPLVTFPPTVENCRSDAFICVNPLVKFQQESNVPVIIGVNSAEGGLIVAPMYNDSSLLYPEFKTDFIKLVSIVLMYKDTALPEDTVTIGEKLLKKYFSSGRVEDQSHLEAVKIL